MLIEVPAGPPADPATDAPMVLTAGGYVGLVGGAASAEPDHGPIGKVSWDENAHPRQAAGDHHGGRFVSGQARFAGPSRRSTDIDRPNFRERVAEVIPICVKGSHSTTIIDGLTHYWAEYDCFDGRSFEKRSIGIGLPGLVRQR